MTEVGKYKKCTNKYPKTILPTSNIPSCTPETPNYTIKWFLRGKFHVGIVISLIQVEAIKEQVCEEFIISKSIDEGLISHYAPFIVSMWIFAD